MLPQGDGLALWLWPCQEPRSGQPAQTPAAAKAAGIRGTMAGLLPGVLLGAWDIWCGGVRGVSSRLQCPNRYLLQPGQRGLGPGWALQSSTQGASTPWRAGGRRPVCSLHDGCVSGGERVSAQGERVCFGVPCLPMGAHGTAKVSLHTCLDLLWEWPGRPGADPCPPDLEAQPHLPDPHHRCPLLSS